MIEKLEDFGYGPVVISSTETPLSDHQLHDMAEREYDADHKGLLGYITKAVEFIREEVRFVRDMLLGNYMSRNSPFR